MSETSTYRVHRALSKSELAAIMEAIERATDLAGIVVGAAHSVFSVLLSPLGESLDDYGVERKLDPAQFAIPQVQWEAICRACLNKADTHGGRGLIVMDLIDVMPANYDDPTATVPSVPATDHRPPEHTITVTREATEVIATASRHCGELARYFGEESRQYKAAVASWQHNLSYLFPMVFGSQSRVMRDSELSLLVHASGGVTYAIIFHPIPRRCAREECQALINNDGRAWTYQRSDPVCPDGQHEPSYPLDAPQPGIWAFHS